VDVRSSDINHFIRRQAAGEFSAKDFRTWGATVLAAMALSISTEVRSERARRRAVEQGATIDPAIVLEHQGGAGMRDALEAAVVDLLEGAHRVTRRHTARAS
jgi:hypothetical protein